MNRALGCVAGALLLAALVVGLPTHSADAKGEARVPSLAKDGPSLTDDYHRTVFFAVLEGLYEAGVENEIVDRVLMPDPKTNVPMHFVPGCPVCVPAIGAFRLYRERPDLGLKRDTFGPGVHEDIRARLMSDVFEDRMRGVWDIIEGSVRRRIERMRLPPEERARWEQGMAERRKKGMAMLKSLQGSGNGGAITLSDRCAACDAANDAFETR